MKLAYFLFFICACHLQSKDVFLDLEGVYPNKSSVTIEYRDKVQVFSAKELVEGVERQKICDVIFYSNLKEAVELCVQSKTDDDGFYLKEEEFDRKIPFFLFLSSDHSMIENGGVIFSQAHIQEPIRHTMSLGVNIPGINKSGGFNGALSAQFTIILKHIG